MTERSTRRAAEMAVLNAAVELIDAPFYADQRARENKLRKAVRAYEQVGLDATHQPAISNNTTETSTAAGASVRGNIGKLARQCFDEIQVVCDSGSHGLTVDQLEQLLNRSHQSVSARVNELRDKGWVVDSGERRKTRSGRSAIVWKPSAASRSGRP